MCFKVHKKLGNTHLALINFSWASDLDPKGANNHIKEALDKRCMIDDDDDDDSSSNLCKLISVVVLLSSSILLSVSNCDKYTVSQKTVSTYFCSIPISIKIDRHVLEGAFNKTMQKLPTSPKICEVTD